MKAGAALLALPLAVTAGVVNMGKSAGAKMEPRALSDGGGLPSLSNLGDSITNFLTTSLTDAVTGLIAPTTKVLKSEVLEPRNPAAKRVRLTWGPLNIRGTNSTSRGGNFFSMDPAGVGSLFRAAPDFPTDVTLLDGIVQIHNKEGKRLTLDHGIYTHHFLIMDSGKPQPPSFACENGRAVDLVPLPGAVITGGAAEDAEAHYSTKNAVPGKQTGYYIKKDSPIVMTVDIVNSNAEDVEIYPTADLEYLPGKPADYLDIAPVFLSVPGCENQSKGMVMMPKSRRQWSVESQGVIMAEDAILSGFRGHMHDGGSSVDFSLNGKLICNSKALYGGPGHVGKTNTGQTWETISDMETCPDGVLARKGDKVSMTARYDIDEHPARQHAHGGGGMFGSITKWLAMFRGGDPDAAEQMAVMIVYTAPINPKSK